MSQVEAVDKQLRKVRTQKGISAKRLSELAKIPIERVYAAVYTLREKSGVNVVSEERGNNGKRQVFYKIAS